MEGINNYMVATPKEAEKFSTLEQQITDIEEMIDTKSRIILQYKDDLSAIKERELAIMRKIVHEENKMEDLDARLKQVKENYNNEKLNKYKENREENM